MTKPLPQNKFLEGIFEPLPSECTINDPIIIGNIPKELSGTFFRNGPNPQYAFSENYHFFEGDGMIHALSFASGEVRYMNRFVRTEKFKLERQARRALFAGFRDFAKSDPSVQKMRAGTANTNIIWHGNKLLALNEGMLPFQLDLDFSNHSEDAAYSFNNHLNSSMTAHPKVDHTTGELIFYSYINPTITDHIYYYVADKNGVITTYEKIDVPYLSLLHDFAITEDYTILPLFPLTASYERWMYGGQFYSWEAKLGSYFGIMPRNGNNNDLIWIHSSDADLAFHTVNAYQDGDKIVLDAMCVHDIPENTDGFKKDADPFPSYLTRWTFDLKSKSIISKTKLDNIAGEFPRIDERFMGKKHNHVYTASTVGPLYSIFDAITHYDLKNGTKQVQHFDNGDIPVEPIFVPRHNDAPEGDGFLLFYVYREQQKRSDLVILDAKRVDAAPLAIVQLPHRVPFGFHGSWVGMEDGPFLQ